MVNFGLYGKLGCWRTCKCNGCFSQYQREKWFEDWRFDTGDRSVSSEDCGRVSFGTPPGFSNSCFGKKNPFAEPFLESDCFSQFYLPCAQEHIWEQLWGGYSLQANLESRLPSAFLSGHRLA